MWNFTATTDHGKTLRYSAPTRTKARAKRDALNRTLFVKSTTTPVKK